MPGQVHKKSVNADKGEVPHEHRVHRKPGGWLPSDHRIHRDWLSGIIDEVDKNPKETLPVIREFQSLIENSTRIYLLFNSMFAEIPDKKPYSSDPTGQHKQIKDYKHLLQVLNHILTTPPHWNDKSDLVGVVGVPIQAILDWPMGTPSGYAAFLDPEVNGMIKKVLDCWGEYLKSEKSACALGTDQSGWFSEHGKGHLEVAANKAGGTELKFEEMFVCNAGKEHHGFKSWDDFFTRKFREGVRPVASPSDDTIIANACESLPYNIFKNVKLRDTFWNKEQPYSLLDMLNHDENSKHFVGGTVYQAFLSALSYHRWHAPVSGTIVKAYVIPGTYYSEPLWEGVGDPNNKEGKIDMGGENTGQGYLAATATRALILIDADNKDIGLMAFLGIGMVEVSTCDITVKEGQKVKKGDEIGMFHFGGSTHCLIFRGGVELEGFPELGRDHNVPVRGELCRVVKSRS
ncbi:hypothetical protein HDV00_008186 [Rhizophlyctis rosea]|nr:hypothetical protein HDV00_008186 [Rhizophlyctis rosea]